MPALAHSKQGNFFFFEVTEHFHIRPYTFLKSIHVMAKFSNQEIYHFWSGVLIPYQEVFYQTILMRVKIYLKVQTQFHCPLYPSLPYLPYILRHSKHCRPRPDCSYRLLQICTACQCFHKTFPDTTKELVQIWKWKSPLIYKNCNGVRLFRENNVPQVCVI